MSAEAQETTAEKPEKPDYFKAGVIVLLTLVSVFAASVTFLQNYASLRSSDLAEQSSFTAVNSTGPYFSAGLAAAKGADDLERYGDAVQRSVEADTKAKALRMGGLADLAAQTPGQFAGFTIVFAGETRVHRNENFAVPNGRALYAAAVPLSRLRERVG